MPGTDGAAPRWRGCCDNLPVDSALSRESGQGSTASQLARMCAAPADPASKVRRQLGLIGAPTDIGAGSRGASMGPEALRVAGIGERLAQLGLDVRDTGNLHGPANPWQPAQSGFRHLPQVAEWCGLVHDATRAELQAAQRRRELAQTTYEREKNLWEQKISPEQDVLQARQALREAEITVANATQKLRTLGTSASSGSLGRLELRAPFDGMVVEKHIALGEAVKEDTTVFTLSDLSSVWTELKIAARDLEQVRVGGQVLVRAGASDATATGTIAYVGSFIGEQTRTAPARVVLANPQGAWRPGLFVTVEVLADEKVSPVTVASSALQTLDDKSVVFLKVPGGFAPQPVQTGRSDGKRVEIVSGLKPGATYAASGSFVIKSEQGKSSATHAH